MYWGPLSDPLYCKYFLFYVNFNNPVQLCSCAQFGILFPFLPIDFGSTIRSVQILNPSWPLLGKCGQYFVTLKSNNIRNYAIHSNICLRACPLTLSFRVLLTAFVDSMESPSLKAFAAKEEGTMHIKFNIITNIA